jgi:hypothetical protein
MGKVIYVLKMFLFREELELAPKIKKGLEQLALFYSLLYVKAWISAPNPADAPRND